MGTNNPHNVVKIVALTSFIAGCTDQLNGVQFAQLEEVMGERADAELQFVTNLLGVSRPVMPGIASNDEVALIYKDSVDDIRWMIKNNKVRFAEPDSKVLQKGEAQAVAKGIRTNREGDDIIVVTGTDDFLYVEGPTILVHERLHHIFGGHEEAVTEWSDIFSEGVWSHWSEEDARFIIRQQDGSYIGSIFFDEAMEVDDVWYTKEWTVDLFISNFEDNVLPWKLEAAPADDEERRETIIRVEATDMYWNTVDYLSMSQDEWARTKTSEAFNIPRAVLALDVTEEEYLSVLKKSDLLYDYDMSVQELALEGFADEYQEFIAFDRRRETREPWRLPVR